MVRLGGAVDPRVRCQIASGRAELKRQRVEQIDSLGGGHPVDGQSQRSEYFIKGTEPTDKSVIYQKLKISKKDGSKLASQEETDKGEYDTKDFIIFKEEDPVSTDGKNRWQEGIEAWIKQTYAADKPQYYPPREAMYGSQPPPQPNTPTPEG